MTISKIIVQNARLLTVSTVLLDIIWMQVRIVSLVVKICTPVLPVLQLLIVWHVQLAITKQEEVQLVIAHVKPVLMDVSFVILQQIVGDVFQGSTYLLVGTLVPAVKPHALNVFQLLNVLNVNKDIT